MNILPLPSAFNLSEPQRNSVKLNSPSYTNTTQTQVSSISKTPHQYMSHNQTLSQQKRPSQPQKTHSSVQTPQMAQKSENNPLLIVDSIKWDNNVSFFTQEMELKVQYTVFQQLHQNITWKATYLGSAYTDHYDQTLIQFQTQQRDPSSSYPQKRQFKLSIQPPKWNLISSHQLFNISAIVISACYKRQEFLKVGFYVHYQLPTLGRQEVALVTRLQSQGNSGEDKQDKSKNLHKTKKITKNQQKSTSSKHHCPIDGSEQSVLESILQRTVRTILAQKPRVTKFQIDWQKQNIAQETTKKMPIQSSPSIDLSNQHLITEYVRVLRSKGHLLDRAL